MKKFSIIALMLVLTMSMAACRNNAAQESTVPTSRATTPPTTQATTPPTTAATMPSVTPTVPNTEGGMMDGTDGILDSTGMTDETTMTDGSGSSNNGGMRRR